MKYYIIVIVLLVVACKKDEDGIPNVGSGNPVASKISPDSAGAGTVLTLIGTGLGDMQSIVFDKNNSGVQFYSTLNTDNAVVFRIPDVAARGEQNILFTNSAGKTLSVPFKVLPFAQVSSAFPTDFIAGTRITLQGNNFDVLSKVVLSGTTTEATIISKSLTEAVIQMPDIDNARGPLVLTTNAGDKATTMDFVNVAKASLPLFVDSLVTPAENWSWGGAYKSSTDNIVTGNASLKAEYDPAGAWGGFKIHMGSPVAIPAGTKYFTFWARGADVDKKVTVQVTGLNPVSDNSTVITVPANKWTYFKFETATFVPNLKNLNEILFQINESGKTLYYDNIMFIK